MILLGFNVCVRWDLINLHIMAITGEEGREGGREYLFIWICILKVISGASQLVARCITSADHCGGTFVTYIHTSMVGYT